MLTRFGADPDFFDVVVQTGSDLPPVLPGETITLELDAAPPHNFLSWASMLICTNDGFTGVDTLKLPSLVGDLDPATNDWDDPIAIVTVERVG